MPNSLECFNTVVSFEALKTVCHYINSACKISRTQQHIAFSQKYRRYQLLRSCWSQPHLGVALHKEPVPSSHRHAEMDLFFQKRQLDHALGAQKLAAIDEHRVDTQTKVSNQTKEQHKKKFNALLTRKTSTQCHGNRWVVNLSSKQLDGPHLSALSKGLNFGPAPARIPTAHIIANVKAAMGRANADESMTAKACMNKADYDHKMQQMLCDKDTYQPLKKDPTTSLENKMNARQLQLKKCGRLPPDVYSRLRSSAGRVPMLYGLPEVHKPDVPLRPIVSFMSSPTYELSKFLARLLAPLVGLTSSHVRNSKAFVEFMRSQILGKEETLVSFDVVSLFTSVPTDRAIRVARHRLESDTSHSEWTSLNVDDIMGLLSPCLDATFLSFRGKVYHQAEGTAMGSPYCSIGGGCESHGGRHQ